HAVIQRCIPGSDPVHQVTIMPRGSAGGFTMTLPEEDRYYATKADMENEIVDLLGGRLAEAIVIGDISTGASNDLEKATKIAHDMVTKYGMSDAIGPVNYSDADEVFLGRDFSTRQNYSEEVAAEVDHEIRRLLEECYAETRRILQENDEAFERVAQALLLVETLDGAKFERLFTGEITPEDLKSEVDSENREIERKNKLEAEESERLEAERRRELEEQRKREQEMQLELSEDLGRPKDIIDWSEEPEDKFGYEEYKRATDKRRKDKVQPKKLTQDKSEPAADAGAESDSEPAESQEDTTTDEKE
ncbi:MAG: zinc metalloprotease, partial [Mogibacterium sp.]|nr:zinc metalloprotease [Mogibacterium sp.]